MDKFSKIQSLLDEQKAKKEKVTEIFDSIFVKSLGLPATPKIKIIFGKVGDEIIKIKVVDRSSLRFMVLKYKDRIVEEYQKTFSDKLFIL